MAAEPGMKKICYVTTISESMRLFVLGSAKHLNAQGSFDITFVCNDDPAFAQVLPGAIHYHPIPMRRGVSPGGIKAVFSLYRFFRAERFDMVQYATPNASLYSCIAARLAKIPVRLYCQWGIRYTGYAGVKRMFFFLLEKLTCRLSTSIHPDGHALREYGLAERLYPAEKASVVWNGSSAGVDLRVFDIHSKAKWRADIRARYALEDASCVVGFVGRITRDKGLNELLEAARVLLDRHKDVKFMLVGAEESTAGIDPALFQWAKRCDRIVFCGHQKDVRLHLAAMDVMVQPSYREGISLAILEAEAMGVPVIVSDIPGSLAATDSGKAGFVIPTANAPALIDALEAAISDPAATEAMGRKGRAFVEQSYDQAILHEKIYLDKKKLLSME